MLAFEISALFPQLINSVTYLSVAFVVLVWVEIEFSRIGSLKIYLLRLLVLHASKLYIFESLFLQGLRVLLILCY